MAEYQDFAKLDIRAGVIVKAEEFTRARNPSYKVWVDFGDEVGVKTTSAQITHHYQLADLPGRRVFGLVNIGERNIAGFLSQFLLLGLPDQQGNIHLATYDGDPKQGAKLC